jgi:uncharacterized OB-fold protein
MADTASTKTTVPAVEGWFELSEHPRLLGTRCKRCKTYFFPKETTFCRNPVCDSSDFEEIALSPTGKLWSFTNNCYAPPAPYVAPDPFVPYVVAAVELDTEKMVVLGQVVPGVKIEDLHAGMKMELALDTLFEDADKRYVVWKWRPA